MLRTLQYFEAVARHGSVKAAAEEIGVSASAVSHQMRDLSTFLGEEIFVRFGRGIRLTERGKRLYRCLGVLFSGLEDVLTEVIGNGKTRLRLAVCTSFGPAWLAARIPEFALAYSNIDLEMRMFARHPLQTEGTADAIVTADLVSDGFDHVPLFEEMLVAVARSEGGPADGEMPAQLITTDLQPHALGKEWREYSDLTGRDFVGSAKGAYMRCTHYLLAMALARAGTGAALVPDFLAADALGSGALSLLDERRLPSGRTYKLCYKASRARDPDLRDLARWMKGQAKVDFLKSTGLPERPSNALRVSKGRRDPGMEAREGAGSESLES